MRLKEITPDMVLEDVVPRLIPAIKVNGKVYKAGDGDHIDALHKIEDVLTRRNAILDGDNRGFVDHRGRFLNRRRAMNYAIENDLIAPRYTLYAKPNAELASEWLKAFWENPRDPLPVRTDRLKEARLIHLVDERNRDFQVIENPTSEQRKTILRRAPYGEVKGIVSKDGLRAYIWAADYGHHAEVHGRLNGMTNQQMFPEPDEDMIMHPDMQNWNTFYVGRDSVSSEDVGVETLAASRAIKRMFDGPFTVHAAVGQSIKVNESADAPTPKQDEWEKLRLAGPVVSGLTVRDHIDNLSSIGASFTDYIILKGIREVPFSLFSGPDRITHRIRELMHEIEGNREITPLIVAIDNYNGPYILEGAHRYDALQHLGIKTFPALVVLDNDDGYFDTEVEDA